MYDCKKMCSIRRGTPVSVAIDPATGRSGRWLVILFYSILFGGTAWVTSYSVQSSYHKRHVQGEFFPHLRCTGIIDPITLETEKHGQTGSVQFLGVLRPSQRRELLNGLDPYREDQIARHTLQAYLYKRRVRFHPVDNPGENSPGTLQVGYVELYGIDVGKKLIENGQAFAAEIDHPRKELYLRMEEKARKARKGVWRNQEPSTANNPETT